MTTKEELDQRGLRVKAEHLRLYRVGEETILLGKRGVEDLKKSGQSLEPETHGGLTRVTVLDKDDQVVGEAAAWCNPIDQFDHKRGFQIALGRALLDPEERKRRDDIRAERERTSRERAAKRQADRERAAEENGR